MMACNGGMPAAAWRVSVAWRRHDGVTRCNIAYRSIPIAIVVALAAKWHHQSNKWRNVRNVIQ